MCEEVCTDLSGKEPHSQVSVDRMIAAGSLGSVMVRTLALDGKKWV